MATLANHWNDIRYSIRRLSSRPGFVAVVVLTLAIGIGVNVAMFSLLQQILLRPLPVPEPERLVNLTDPGPDMPGPQNMSLSGTGDSIFSYPMFRDLERMQEPFVGIAAHKIYGVTLSTGEQAQRDTGLLVSGSYFSVLGLEPELGRLLGPTDDGVDGQAETVVLSHAYWQRAFGADPGVLGRTLTVNGVPLTIVGVAPRGFQGTTVGVRASVFLPITFRWLDVTSDDSPDDRRYRWVYLFARLAPDVDLDQAQAAINVRYRAILNDIDAPLYDNADADAIERFRTKSVVLVPGAQGQSLMLAPIGERLMLLFAVSGVVLLLCCANVAGLTLVRTAARHGEMAVRASLGAGRLRLVSLLLTESLLVAVPAAIASVPVAMLTLRGMAAGMGELAGIPTAAYNVELDPGAVLVAIGITVVSAAAFGFFPAVRLMRTDPIGTLKTYGVRQTADKAVTRFSTVLATAQVALSMSLLAMVGVFGQSLGNIARVDLGLDADPVVMFSMSPGTSGYSTDASATLYDELEVELSAIPGVVSAASSELPWLSGFPRTAAVFPDGADEPSATVLHYVGPGLFGTLGMRLLEGRDFTEADRTGARQVAIANRSFVERFGLGSDAVGERITLGPGGPVEIVGVAADAKYLGVTSETEPQLFRPRRQTTELASATFYVRGAGRPEDLIDIVRETVARVDSVVPMTDLRTMQQQVRDNVAQERFVAGTTAAFAVLATVLAGLGLYGVLAYAVAQRSREIGLRVALGAPPARIRDIVLRRVAAMALAGAALGALGAILLGRAAGSLLFGIEGANAVALAGGAAVLAVVTLAAALIPARRASRVDPIVVLRYE